MKIQISTLLTAVLQSLCVAAAATPRIVVKNDSSIEFVVREMGVPVTGTFRKFESTIDIDAAHPEKSNAVLVIDIASLDTGNVEADAIATNSDWLDKARSPRGTFKSTAIRALGGGRFEARGTLDLRGKPHDCTFQFSSVEQSSGSTAIASEFVIKRGQYGIGAGEWNQDGVVAEDIVVKVHLVLAPPSGK
jgi:polyisoprenoid-binding protein YceI